ncbi:MAG TPA: right-handed parallel beta-helix repeat-containing protein [Sedimentisphaerales bacterium]|nr:right-handed parallel beta-helix repeat-containing protein [Sedimentisphaerales bacterium]
MKNRCFQGMWIGLVLMLGLSFCAAANGKTWYVSGETLAGIEQQEQVRTIAQAAALVEPGDTVIIHSGIYREATVIEKSGKTGNPITFQAAAGAGVIMTGADRISEWTEVKGDGRIYSTPWPHEFITWNRQNTHPDDDYHRLIGRCEQVFINGYALRQVLERDKLSRGTFYVDLNGKRLYVWNYDNQDLSSGKVTVEASVRDRILTVKGDYVTVKGIRFRYAANRAQHGAVEFSGNHLTVEDCVFEYTNAGGASFRGEDITVRRCTFQYNGQLGFGAGRAHRLLMTGCTVRNNNIKGFNRGWEAGGNKICLARGVVLENSTFVENRGNGIWFDIGNEDCTVRNCLIANNEDAGIFYEISYGLHAHDNVIVGNGLAGTSGAWGASAGISISSSPDCLIERNLLIGNKEGFNFREQTRSTPRIDGRKSEPVWNHDHIIRNNVIALNRDAQTWGWFDVPDNRHWPSKGGDSNADELSLEKLALTLRDNLYFAAPGAELFNWGVTWKENKRYQRLEQVQEELGLEQGSMLTEFTVNDFSALDFRVPVDSPAVKMRCYPQGKVPGVQLGTLE